MRLARVPEQEEVMNAGQKALYEHYRGIDSEAQILGHHRGRPVIYTHLTVDHWREPKPKRHVVVLQAMGGVGDLSPTWEDHFVFDGEASAPVVRCVIEDWLTWAVRA